MNRDRLIRPYERGVWSSVLGILVYAPLMLISGCATNALWDNTANFSEPAPRPHLQLFEAQKQNDFLVVYDECYGRKGAIRKRAYFLFQNQQQITKHQRPKFVGTNTMEGLPELAVFETRMSSTNLSLYAVAIPTAHDFKLYVHGAEDDVYRLPVYSDGKKIYTRAALLPLTVTADAVLFGGVLGIFAAESMATSGESIEFP